MILKKCAQWRSPSALVDLKLGFGKLRQAFDSRHKDAFGYADTTNDAEIVNIRLVSVGVVDKPTLEFTPPSAREIKSYRRDVWFGDWVETTIYDRDTLQTDFEFSLCTRSLAISSFPWFLHTVLGNIIFTEC